MRPWLLPCTLAAAAVGLAFAPLSVPRQSPTATPAELVDAYGTLADAILATKKTERHMVRSILSATYRHAEGVVGRVQGELAAGRGAPADLERLAELVAQLGNEGDAAVAAVRKRLLEGGHHHNAEGERQGIYDEGFVIVTRAAKKELLDAARAIAQLGGKPQPAALEAQWKRVATQYDQLLGKAAGRR